MKYRREYVIETTLQDLVNKINAEYSDYRLVTVVNKQNNELFNVYYAILEKEIEND